MYCWQKGKDCRQWGGVNHHFAVIDSVTRDIFTGAPLVIIRVLGEDKIVHPEALIQIKRPKKV